MWVEDLGVGLVGAPAGLRDQGRFGACAAKFQSSRSHGRPTMSSLTWCTASCGEPQAQVAHQPLDRAARHSVALPVELDAPRSGTVRTRLSSRRKKRLSSSGLAMRAATTCSRISGVVLLSLMMMRGSTLMSPTIPSNGSLSVASMPSSPAPAQRPSREARAPRLRGVHAGRRAPRARRASAQARGGAA
jgi:hypothetical protein